MDVTESYLAERIVIDASRIRLAVVRLASEILAAVPSGDLLLIGILEGARPFTTDLADALRIATEGSDRRIEVDWLRASSYQGAMVSSGCVQLLEEPTVSLRARQIILIDDIIDEGHTLATVVGRLQTFQPSCLRVCVLLDKPQVRKRTIVPDHVGFPAPNAFIVGYGLDYQENYRNLPYLAALPNPASE